MLGSERNYIWIGICLAILVSLVSDAVLFYKFVKIKQQVIDQPRAPVKVTPLSRVPTPISSLITTKSPTPTLTLSIKPTATPTQTPANKPATLNKDEGSQQFYVTFYGWPDNSPPGNKIAYPKSLFPGAIHETAGGLGTYQDPITFASDPERISVGSIFYAPYLKKYIVMEDYCTSCVNHSRDHLDIWMESRDEFVDQLFNCQGRRTRRSVEIITSPSNHLPVDPRPLFNLSTGECLQVSGILSVYRFEFVTLNFMLLHNGIN